jgi:hypothetical protein
MLGHLESAKQYRRRAARCGELAQATSSEAFGKCYRIMAEYFISLADLEEDFVRRAVASKMSHT